MTKLAVVLFNLGAPDRLEAVQPFLFNLFSDKAILSVPQPLRWALAKLISSRRAKVAQDIYARVGGGSPLLPNTLAQAAALRGALAELGSVQVVPAMRYWHPFSDEIASRVREFAPDNVILLPLYPQYSTTTTGSSLRAWQRAAAAAGLKARTRAVCCYPVESGFVAAVAEMTAQAYTRAQTAAGRAPRVLFSAHGLPKRTIQRGDPYQAQVEMTAAAIVRALAIPDLDWQVCYQSRVGPLEWIGPYAEDEIARAGADKAPLVVVPVAFVSEHSETLVELDMIYRDEARACGVPHYERVPAVGTHPKFIAGLARLVTETLERKAVLAPDGNERICPGNWQCCALAGAAR
jgi:ferrochelatase